MAIGVTVGEAADRGRGGVRSSQGRGGHGTATKSGENSLDLTGNL